MNKIKIDQKLKKELIYELSLIINSEFFYHEIIDYNTYQKTIQHIEKFQKG